jgi:hypothetical protein
MILKRFLAVIPLAIPIFLLMDYYKHGKIVTEIWVAAGIIFFIAVIANTAIWFINLFREH